MTRRELHPPVGPALGRHNLPSATAELYCERPASIAAVISSCAIRSSIEPTSDASTRMLKSTFARGVRRSRWRSGSTSSRRCSRPLAVTDPMRSSCRSRTNTMNRSVDLCHARMQALAAGQTSKTVAAANTPSSDRSAMIKLCVAVTDVLGGMDTADSGTKDVISHPRLSWAVGPILPS